MPGYQRIDGQCEPGPSSGPPDATVRSDGTLDVEPTEQACAALECGAYETCIEDASGSGHCVCLPGARRAGGACAFDPHESAQGFITYPTGLDAVTSTEFSVQAELNLGAKPVEQIRLQVYSTLELVHDAWESHEVAPLAGGSHHTSFAVDATSWSNGTYVALLSVSYLTETVELAEVSFQYAGVCVPDCEDKECGPDGCGGECGSCALLEACHDHGFCALGGEGREMVVVPAGTFLRGCDPELDADCGAPEQPIREIYLDAFAIDVVPVAQLQLDEFVDAMMRSGVCTSDLATGDIVYVCPTTMAHTSASFLFIPARSERDLPARQMPWLTASLICQWMGRRLCTEAEWEKAARGMDERKYPWGNGSPTCELADFDAGTGPGCGTGAPSEVGSRPLGASPYGVLDMAGGLWEWVGDWYAPTYYANSPDTNPSGPPTGAWRVVRGGTHYSDATGIRSARRHAFDPGAAEHGPLGAPTAHRGIGHRCCVSLDEEAP